MPRGPGHGHGIGVGQDGGLHLPTDGVDAKPGLEMCCRDVSSAHHCKECIQAAALASPRRLSMHLRRSYCLWTDQKPIWKVWRHTALHHWIVTAEALVAHSWFWYTPGRLPTTVVAFSMVPGLPWGPGVHFGAADLQRRTKVKFVRQSKSSTDPLPSTAVNYMSRSATQVGKVVDQV